MPLPPLEELLGANAYRLRGIQGWGALPHLGTGNLARLESLATQHIHEEMTAGEDRATLRALATGVRELKALASEHDDPRPYLPRLRNELFAPGDDVVVFLGDTPGGAPGWRRARVECVEKAFELSWARDSSARGFYWRVTASDPDGAPLLPGHRALSFSTTEPRVLLEREHRWLAQRADHEFTRIFCENAWRTWTPIWCIEANLPCDADSMNMKAWLAHAT